MTASTQTLRIERVFDCTPDELWDAWTRPDEFARWINPFPGLDAEVPVLEARPGGRLVFVMPGPGGERFHEEGVFEVVDRPRELVIYQPHDDPRGGFAGYPFTMRVRFTAEGDRTRMVFEQAGFPAAFPIGHAYEGFEAAFAKLASRIQGA